jgi:hypothetical protein
MREPGQWTQPKSGCAFQAGAVPAMAERNLVFVAAVTALPGKFAVIAVDDGEVWPPALSRLTVPLLPGTQLALAHSAMLCIEIDLDHVTLFAQPFLVGGDVFSDGCRDLISNARATLALVPVSIPRSANQFIHKWMDACRSASCQ